MTYYKLINGRNFVGVATQLNFREYQQKHNIILCCDEEKAQYIQLDDSFYRADWMKPVITDKILYETIQVIQIDETEYNTLYSASESGETIEIPQEEEIIEEPVADPIGEVTVEYIKAKKISEMSAICNQLITNGVDVTLSDGEIHHFSLTIQDQLNLITLSSLAANGETEIPYHADGELCKYYPVTDILAVVNAAASFKTYHVTYFNSLKVYIESLNDVEDISPITYGIAIPEEFQSDILKAILSQVSD